MNKLVGRLLLLSAALIIAGILGYYFFTQDMNTVKIVLLGTAFMLLGELTYHLDKKWFQDK